MDTTKLIPPQAEKDWIEYIGKDVCFKFGADQWIAEQHPQGHNIYALRGLRASKPFAHQCFDISRNGHYR